MADYFSQWINKNSSSIINKFKECFSRREIPVIMIITDISFNSLEFKMFAMDWNLKIQTSISHYSKENDLAEKKLHSKIDVDEIKIYRCI